MSELMDKVIERIGTAASLQRIKFGRGVVGKLAWIAVAALAAFAYMAPRLPQNMVFPTVIIAAVLIVLIVGSIVLIALKKPELAVTEGMEVVALKRTMIEAKDYSPGKELPPIPDPGLPALGEGGNNQ